MKSNLVIDVCCHIRQHGDNMRNTRPINWVKGALKDFQRFPEATQGKAVDALTIVADGATPGIAKPLSGLGSGV